MEKIKLQLFSNYIALDAVQRNVTKVIVPNIKDKTTDGTYFDLYVAGVSEEKEEGDKPFIKNVQLGDKVLLSPFSSPASVEIGEKKYLIVRETELIGIFPKEEPVSLVN